MQQAVTTRTIMRDFASSTGLTDTSVEPRRYLWTDAFAVCNYLALYRQTNEAEYLQLALDLVDQVHLTLGKHHPDSEHSGWLSGLNDKQARLHPTKGGLRIGKRLNERQPGEGYDSALEWDRDGQYFHYLTKWMHALNRVSQVTGKSIYNQWAVELAKVAYAAFSYTVTGTGIKRMYWKMSIDLSRPLVESMGQHDPLDGYITCLQLEATANSFSENTAKPSLKTEIGELAKMCKTGSWATEDPLGIGGLLSDAYRLTRLINIFHLQETTRLQALLHDIELSLQAFTTNNPLNYTADYRLAFRELGLSIGLHAISRIQQTIEQHPENFSNGSQLHSMLTELTRYSNITDLVEAFWLNPENRSASNWREHADINNVMLATSLAPQGFL